VYVGEEVVETGRKGGKDGDGDPDGAKLSLPPEGRDVIELGSEDGHGDGP
jgi:hypothetical protein